ISMTSSEIAATKERITRLSAKDCRELFINAVQSRDPQEIAALLQRDSLVTQERRLLDPDLILFDSESESKEEAIRQILDAFFVAGRTSDPEAVEEAIWARESVYSTGLGYGFAVPHCKTDAVSSGCLAILKLK